MIGIYQIKNTMTKINELQQGDELICYMRLGLALERTVKGDGSPYRKVPRKPQRARSGALTRFTGVVQLNNTTAEVLTIFTTRLDSQKIAVNDTALTADIHYSAFRRIQRLSKFHTEAFETFGGRPTKREGLGTNRKHFRTLEEIELWG